MSISAEQFEQLLPLAIAWAREQEAEILARGVPLQESGCISRGLELAAQARLQNPQRVRLLRVATIPEPQSATLAHAACASGFITSHAAGLTLGHGIFLREDAWGNSQLLLHELTHVHQYEERGIEDFLREYLWAMPQRRLRKRAARTRSHRSRVRHELNIAGRKRRTAAA